MTPRIGGDQPIAGIPHLRAGFDHFTRFDPWINRLVYVVGFLVYLGAYAVAARRVTGTPTEVLSTSAAMASAVVAVYFLATYFVAAGTPLGNVFGSFFVLVATPRFAYRALTPSRLGDFENVVLLPEQGGALYLASWVAPVVSSVLLAIGYRLLVNRTEWEKAVMPGYFGFAGLFESRQSWRELPTLVRRGFLKSRVFGEMIAFAAIATIVVAVIGAVLTSFTDIPFGADDAAGALFVITIYVGIRRSERNYP